ncbi:MAG: DinB family protein [Sphingobacteriales bacterium]|nr:DinB family protein [Sphingobacteriales bacterium]
MKELLQQMAAYNNWANQRIVEAVLSLPEEKCLRELPSSFKTLQATLLHIWDAESAWWQRLRLQERVEMPGKNFSGSTREAGEGLVRQSGQWENWVKQASVISLDHVIQYYNNKREPVKIQTSQLLLHVFNHSNYHRGQLITLFHQLGHTKLPATDFFLWSKSKK